MSNQIPTLYDSDIAKVIRDQLDQSVDVHGIPVVVTKSVIEEGDDDYEMYNMTRDKRTTLSSNILKTRAIIAFPESIISFKKNKHLYFENLLPIVGYFKFVDNVKKGDLVEVPFRNERGDDDLIKLEITDLLATGQTETLSVEYRLALYRTRD